MFKIGLILLVFVVVQARYFETAVKFSLFGRNRGWVYVDKMTFAPGTARVQFQTSTSGLPYGRSSQLFLQAIPQNKWQNEMNLRCNSSVTRPLSVHQINLDGQTTFSSFSFQLQDYTTYYFVMKDCQSRFLSEYNNSNISVYLKLHLLNNDSELGEEEDHWYIAPLIIIAGLAIVQQYLKKVRDQGPRQLEWPFMMLFMGTVTQISSLFWKSLGFVVYTFTGVDYYFFHIIYLLLHSTSEAAIIGLLCLVSFGWTLTFQRGKYFDVFMPLVACMAFVNVMITVVTKIGHQHDRHHLFDNVGGSILIGFRIILVLVFIGGCFYTYRHVRVNLKKFLIKLSMLGFLYIASMPVIVMLANSSIAAKHRHQFVFISIQIIKFATNMILGYQMHSQGSQYNRVNYKNASFIPDEETGFK